MTRKHFQQVADIIRKRAEEDTTGTNRGILSEMTADFVLLFQASNPRFDVAKFYEACGMDSEGLWII